VPDLEDDSFKQHVDIYDTTLRDGAQMVGISLTCDNKLEVAQRLCDLGVAYIEGGWPGSNPKDQEFFLRWQEVESGSTKLSAFGSTRHKNKTCEEDKQVQMLLQCGAEVICIVAKAWNEQVEQVLEATLEQNLEMIHETVEYLVGEGREVMVDLEHYFDGCAAMGGKGEQYALRCLQTAASAGATTLVLCDTNGGTMPWVIQERTSRALLALSQVPHPHPAKIGIHTHNDTGMAVANSIAAVRAGARLVQGCINGYGERTGNADLNTVIGNLQIKMGYSAIHPSQLPLLTSTAVSIASICSQLPPSQAPFVGSSAFAHKGGLHVAAVRKMPHSYNHIEPALVGNTMRAVISELSGKGNVLSQAELAGFSLDHTEASSLLTKIKKLESNGYSFEGAEASVNMIILRSRADYVQPFRVLEYSVVSQNRELEMPLDMKVVFEDDPVNKYTNQAMLKLMISADNEYLDEESYMLAAEGNGPVSALTTALRKALDQQFPQLRSVELQDYTVRLLDDSGSESITRVTVKMKNAETGAIWKTVGAHSSIVEASFRAICDGLEFGIVNCSGSLQDCAVQWSTVDDGTEDSTLSKNFDSLNDKTVADAITPVSSNS